MNSVATNPVNGNAFILPEGSKAPALEEDDFLNLLVTQLQNQNPLEPMDNTEFVTQLAQFSTLEGITNMGTGISNMSNYMLSMNNYNATGLIGKEIKAFGDGITLQENGTAQLNYLLNSDAGKVTVSIYDGSGSVVRTIEEAGKETGTNTLIWDGKDASGTQLPPGEYTFKISATSIEGAPVPVSTITNGVVSGVVYENSIPYLMVGDAKVSMGNVLEVWDV